MYCSSKIVYCLYSKLTLMKLVINVEQDLNEIKCLLLCRMSQTESNNHHESINNEDMEELDKWIWNMGKIFVVVEVCKDKKVNIGQFYESREADIWWNTTKDKCQEPEFTWSKFLEELRANIYVVSLQRQKEKDSQC